MGCIGELILGLGGKESTASDKLFSTVSVEDGAVGTPTRSVRKPAEPGGPRSGLGGGRGDGDSPVPAKLNLAALEMEVEAQTKVRFVISRRWWTGYSSVYFGQSGSPVAFFDRREVGR